MIQVAMVNSNGEVVSVLSPSMDNLYENGCLYGDLTAYHISPDEDPGLFCGTRYYDFDTQSFQPRIMRPSQCHDWNKVTKDWEFNRERAVNMTRLERTRKLNLSDWTQVPDSPLSAEQKAAWQTYRQALRDLPSTIPQDIMSIAEILWPSPPS